jgi:hypothetical protein
VLVLEMDDVFNVAKRELYVRSSSLDVCGEEDGWDGRDDEE